MSENLLITMAVALSMVVAVLIAALGLVARRLWQLMASVECLCNNLGGLREQIGRGGHGHA